MNQMHTILLFLALVCATCSGRECPVRVPDECEEKCLQYAFNKNTRCSSCQCVELKGLWETDIMLDDVTKARLKQLLNRNPKGGDLINGKWRDFRKKGEWWIPYVLHESLTPEAKDGIAQAIADFELNTCLRFHPRRKGQKNYIIFFKGNGCWSYVGRNPDGVPNKLSIGNGCELKGIVIREIMHAIGFWHEQSRPDRDDHVKIHWANIIPGIEHNYHKYTTSEVESYGSPYDIGSIMHYLTAEGSIDPSVPLLTITDLNDQPIKAQMYEFSKSDIKQINAMYRCGSENSETFLFTAAKEPCVNRRKEKNCYNFAIKGRCSSEPITAVRYCRKMCGLCK